MNKKILMDEMIGGNRLLVTYDQHNWIIKFGSAKWTESTFRRKADHWYFNNFESLLSKVFRLMLRYNLRSLDYGDVLEAIAETKRLVSEIGDKLDKKIRVQDGCR